MSWLDDYITTKASDLVGENVKGPVPNITSVFPIKALWASDTIITRATQHRDPSDQRPAGRNATLFMVVRRLGCPLCRAPCLEIAELRDEFAKMGVSVVAIAPSETGASDFAATIFAKGDAVFIDRKGVFKKAMGSREYKEWWALSPSVMIAAGSAYMSGGAKFDDLIETDVPKLRGGELIVDSMSEKVIYEHLEGEYFDHAKASTLLEFCRGRYGGTKTGELVLAAAKSTAAAATESCDVLGQCTQARS